MMEGPLEGSKRRQTNVPSTSSFASPSPLITAASQVLPQLLLNYTPIVRADKTPLTCNKLASCLHLQPPLPALVLFLTAHVRHRGFQTVECPCCICMG